MSLQRRAQLAASGNSGSKQARALADIHPAQDGSEATHFAWSALYIRLAWSIRGSEFLGPKPTSNPVQVCRESMPRRILRARMCQKEADHLPAGVWTARIGVRAAGATTGPRMAHAV